MVSPTVSIDIPKFSNGAFFARFWEILESKKAQAEYDIKSLLLVSATYGHTLSKGRHYKNQTGRLNRSTKVDGSLGYGEQIRLYVDTEEVDYAKYVINPRKNGSWSGDPFINEALDYNRDKIMVVLRDLYNESITEFNRRS